MWQLLLAAAVAGFTTKHFITPRNRNTVDLHDPNAFPFNESESVTTSQTQQHDGVFTFSSSQSLTHDGSRSQNGVRASKVRSEQRKKRSYFCLKKRRTIRNVAKMAPFCNSKDNSLFGSGLGFGILYMMSAGKSEINKLNNTMDETARLVQELKSELHGRKSPCPLQKLDSVDNVDVNNAMLKKINSKQRDTDVKIWSPGLNDCGECGSSALTEEPEPRVLQMDQLEAELEFELQKLSEDIIDSPCHKKIKPKLDKLEAPDEGYHAIDDWNLNYSESHGVSAPELHQKLSQLLIKQQESQITELESELQQAQSNILEKEAELQALKDCVKSLTELSLSTVSDNETQALTDPKGTSDRGNNSMDSKSKHSLAGTKRPIDSEYCSCCT